MSGLRVVAPMSLCVGRPVRQIPEPALGYTLARSPW